MLKFTRFPLLHCLCPDNFRILFKFVSILIEINNRPKRKKKNNRPAIDSPAHVCARVQLCEQANLEETDPCPFLRESRLGRGLKQKKCSSKNNTDDRTDLSSSSSFMVVSSSAEEDEEEKEGSEIKIAGRRPKGRGSRTMETGRRRKANKPQHRNKTRHGMMLLATTPLVVMMWRWNGDESK